MIKKQLFMLPFAGGNVYSFNFLKQQIPSSVEVIVLELPGRGKRIAENLLTNKKDVVGDYVRQIKQSRKNVPYAIYGHSMGAIIGLSVTNEMEAIGDDPVELIVSGNAGPGTGENKDRHLMDDFQFKNELIELGGVPQEVLDTPELFEFFAPIIRADFEVLEKNPIKPESIKLRTPVKVIMGSEECTVMDIENWKKYTTSNCTCKVVEGNHFFIHKHVEFMAETLIK